ncbi:MAG TPA: response regulator [Burkholderiales bacterium]|jgi:CheY-like chemotaxis protein|nr:response regulator [Burkholderiales bacterium]
MQVIIVEDEPVSLTVLRQIVEKLPDCRVQGFTEACTALTWCRRNEPDLVIVGYMMPELNGIEFTEHFRRLPGKADTPVLMVTASTDREVRNSAFENGVNDFLNKPYDSVELQARVSNMLVLRSKQASLAKRAAFRPDDASKRGASGSHAQPVGADRLLDLEITLKRLADDETLLGQVARVFVRTVPQLLHEISSALAKNDSERAYAEAHSLKGAVAVFEAPQVLSAIVTLETHATNYNAAAAATAFEAAQALVQRLSAELELLTPPNAKSH